MTRARSPRGRAEQIGDHHHPTTVVVVREHRRERADDRHREVAHHAEDAHRGGSALAVRVHRHTDGVGPVTHDRAGERQVDPAQARVVEHLGQRLLRLPQAFPQFALHDTPFPSVGAAQCQIPEPSAGTDRPLSRPLRGVGGRACIGRTARRRTRVRTEGHGARPGPPRGDRALGAGARQGHLPGDDRSGTGQAPECSSWTRWPAGGSTIGGGCGPTTSASPIWWPSGRFGTSPGTAPSSRCSTTTTCGR